MTKGIVSGIQKFSLHDGPGIRTVVFLKGCPMTCPWCSNPETQHIEPQVMFEPSLCIGCGLCENGCPTGARSVRGKEMTVSEVLEAVTQDVAFYRKSGGGVTFSGGEALMQDDFLAALAEACRKEGFHTCLETAGAASSAAVNRVLPHMDLVLFDLKIMDIGLHNELLGFPLEMVIDNLKRFVESGKEVIARVPVIPGYTDAKNNLEAIALLLEETGVSRVNLLPYHDYGAKKYGQLGREYRLKDEKTMKNEALCEFIPLFKEKGIWVKIGG